MSYPITIAAVIVALAFVAHTIVGTREALSTRPRDNSKPDADAAERIDRSWAQSLCAFQLVTVDLLALSVLLFALATSDVLPARKQLASIAAAFFALWGVAWLVQLLLLRRSRKDFVLLGQWLAWFACAALLWWGAKGL
jgi:hypothetical protein